MTRRLSGASNDYEDDFDDAEFNGPARRFSIPNLDQENGTNDSSRKTSALPSASLPTPINRKSGQFHIASSSASTKISNGCGTRDFQVSLDSQTDELNTFSSWTQAPPSSDALESGDDKVEPFSQITGNVPSSTSNRTTRPGPSDSAHLRDFLKRAGNIVLEMLAEDEHERRTTVVRKKNRDEEPVLVGQEVCGPHVLFNKCQIEHVSGGGSSSAIFLICHSLLPATGPSNSRVRGFISGWNVLSVSSPLFILASYDIATRAQILFSSDIGVVAGHRDGSLVCWDRRDVGVPYGALLAGDRPESAENSLTAWFQVTLPCFNSCASKADNHVRPVVDLVTLANSDTESGCASLDEAGVIFVWHGVQRSANESWKEVDVVGAAPGSRLVLVQVRRVVLSVVSPATKLLPDPTDHMIFFVMLMNGELRRVHRDDAVLHPNTYGSEFSTDVSLCFSKFERDIFLAARYDGLILLYNKNFTKPVSTWTSTGVDRLLSVHWADDNPRVFLSVNEAGLVTLWNLEKDVGDPVLKTTRVTGDDIDHRVATWTGAVHGSERCVVLWTKRLAPFVVYLNSFLLQLSDLAPKTLLSACFDNSEVYVNGK